MNITKKTKEVNTMVDIKPIENYFNSLPSTPIINRLNAMRGKSQEEKQARYNEAMSYLDKRNKRKKRQKAFDRALTN